MLFGIERRVGWMDWYLICKITILLLKKLEGIIKLEGIVVIFLQSSLSPLIRPSHEGYKMVGPSGFALPPLLPLSLSSLQPNNGLDLSLQPSPSLHFSSQPNTALE